MTDSAYPFSLSLDLIAEIHEGSGILDVGDSDLRMARSICQEFEVVSV